MYVTFHSVTKTIRQNTVVDGVSLKMESGRVCGFQGKNGSGKTMLMKLLCGLIRPSSGTIEIGSQTLGKDISFPPSIGALIENPAFLPGESAYQNLKIINDLTDTPVTPETIRETIEQVGLSHAGAKPYRQFSLGMKQRLGIAAAILGTPEIVVLDEPTNALDQDGVALMREICAFLKNAGCLVVLSCHDAEELDLLCDSVFVIRSGKLTAIKEKTPEGEWSYVET